MRTIYLKKIIFGGRIEPQGNVAQRPPVNFKPGATKNFLIGFVALLIAPLLFVESNIGIIPFKYPEGFIEASMAHQYLQAIAFNSINVLGQLLMGGGFSPEIPMPKGLAWQFLASLVLLLLNFVTLTFMILGGKKIYDNYQTFKRRIE